MTGLTITGAFAERSCQKCPNPGITGEFSMFRLLEKGEKGKPARPDRGPRHKDGDRFKAFKEADIDKDGTLNFDEFSQMGRVSKLESEKRRKLFDYLDRDKDGKVQMRELQPREPGWVGALRRGFNQLDLDKNGTLSLQEFSRLADFAGKKEEMVARFFVKMDRNKNKEIERNELKVSGNPRSRPHFDFGKYDINTSGGLDLEEYSKIPWMDKWPEDRRKKLFQRIDVDKNGEISLAEIRSAHQHHRPESQRKPTKPHRGDRSRDGDQKPPAKPHGKPRRRGSEHPAEGDSPASSSID